MHNITENVSDKSEPIIALNSLPDSFSWRDNNGDWTTPIRDQGSCGNCWAFATTGAFESYYEIKNQNPNLDPDFSEQYLVSCAKDQRGCNGGFINSMGYFVNKAGSGEVGTVKETVYPYAAKTGSCKSLFGQSRYAVRTYEGESWSYVGAGESDLPPDDQIKTAIYRYGPVAARIYADVFFFAYGSGILQSPTRPSYTNHAIIIAGWGTSHGKTYWICKNSYGTGWGESGWFRIFSGELRVGEGAAYFRYSKNQQKGYLLIQSSPSGAEISLDGEDSGYATPKFFSGLITGTHTICLNKNGYDEWTGKITLIENSISKISATLKKLPNPGTLSVKSIPSGSMIWFDRVNTGYLTPKVMPGISAGQHTLLLQMNGFANWSKNLMIKPDNTLQITGTLDREREIGTLEIRSTPPGVIVYVDGKNTGYKTPVTFVDILSGEHTIVLKSDDYSDWSQKIRVKQGGLTVIDAVLTRNGEYGLLKVYSTPAGASIFMDGTNSTMSCLNG